MELQYTHILANILWKYERICLLFFFFQTKMYETTTLVFLYS